MNKIGMFFGTETGTTRLIAKKMQKQLGDDVCDKPVNVNRITPDDMLKYDALILGTPSYGIGEIPGKGASSGCFEPNWEEFLALLPADVDFSGKRIAFFGLGAQERYADRFCSSLFALLGQPPRFKQVPVGLLDAIIGVLGVAGRLVPALADKAELARIGRYYATESMLVYDAHAGRYDADATPSTGSETLFSHYAGLVSGAAVHERGDHTVY